MIILRAILCFSVLNIAIGAKLPSNLIRCHRKDKVCLKNAIQDAIPKFAKGYRSMGILGVDPLIIPKMVVPSGGAVVKLTQTYTDSQLIGLSTITFDEVDFDIDAHKLTWSFQTPKLVFKGNYEMDGQILVLPVKGKGTMEITLEGIKGGSINSFDIIKKDKKEYFKLTNNTFYIDADNVIYDFKNLFDGNEELGKQINQVLNENSRDVFNELKVSYNRAFGTFTDNIADMFMSMVPIDEIFLD